jgi:transcriptional regulator GlxA family with amidase domain
MEAPPRLPVVVLAYDGVAADETSAIVEILTSAELEVTITSFGRDPVTSYHGRVFPTRTVDELRGCSALIIPGGMGVKTASQSQQLADAVSQLAESATWLGATSTGSVLLGAAGVVDGATATTHWLAGDLLTSQGLTLVSKPFVEHGRLLTASGLVSAATLAFRLIGALAGVEAERTARARYQGPPAGDPRYRPRRSLWHRIRRKRLTTIEHHLDPTGRAEITILDLDR